MSRNRFDDKLNEPDARVIAEAEADLARLLSIEPSPDFAAKVRVSVDSQRAASSRWFTGWQIGLAAASLVIVGIIVTLAVRRSATNVAPTASAVATAEPAPAMVAPTMATTTPIRDPDQVVTRPVESRRSHAPLREPRALSPEPRATSNERRTANEPEVLVPPDQRLAIARALAMSRTGALDERMFAEPLPTVGGAEASIVPPIVVEDVVVPPISVPGGGIEKDSGRTDSNL